MTKGGVSEVVAQRYRLGKILVETQAARDCAGDLHHLDGVRQPCALVVVCIRDEYLSFVLQAAEGARVDNPVAVVLEGGAQAVLPPLCVERVPMGGPRGELGAGAGGRSLYAQQVGLRQH